MRIEKDRIAALNFYEILDTPQDGAFDTIVKLATDFLDVPIALISLVDEDRIWFKSGVGLSVKQLNREPGFCSSAIISDEFYEVQDALKDIRSKNHSLVRQKNGLRFYAAQPLTTIDGFNLGTLCVMDRKPRMLNKEQKDQLKMLAAVVMQQLETRLKSRIAVQAQLNLSNMVTHDLKNSIGNIPLLMDILLEQADSPDKVKNIAKLTQNAAKKSYAVIQQYMLEAEKFTIPEVFKKEVIDFTKLLKSVIKVNEVAATRKKQIIQTSLPDKLILKGDEKKLAELADNLINNAVKYSPIGKSIYVELSKDLMNCTLIVRDNGLGMTKDDLQKAFIRFSKLSAKPTGDEESTGLGLWIVKEIAEKHNGSVRVTSEGKNKGTTFEVKIALK